jgi:lipopolysaccharide biosynthesis glycosyltransferase
MTRSCFFLAADGKYFPYACLTARRIRDVSGPIDGFILHVGVNDDDMKVAKRLLGDSVTMLDVSAFMDDVGFRFGTYSIAAYVRLFADMLPQFSPYDRIAYTDCDVLFNRDINDLAGQELHAPLLAAHDDYMYFRPAYREVLGMQPGAPYFNSGVVLFDMNKVREQRLLARTRQVAIAGKMNDQNALNIAFEGKWQTMHPNWNLMSNYTKEYRFAQAYARHFAGGKPWADQVGVELDALAVWRDLAKETPWVQPFQQRIPFERGVMKRFLRRFDAVGGFLLNDERYKRRARYDGRKTHMIYAEHAIAGAMAVKFPEVLGGFGPPAKDGSAIIASARS